MTEKRLRKVIPITEETILNGIVEEKGIDANESEIEYKNHNIHENGEVPVNQSRAVKELNHLLNAVHTRLQELKDDDNTVFKTYRGLVISFIFGSVGVLLLLYGLAQTVVFQTSNPRNIPALVFGAIFCIPIMFWIKYFCCPSKRQEVHRRQIVRNRRARKKVTLFNDMVNEAKTATEPPAVKINIIVNFRKKKYQVYATTWKEFCEIFQSLTGLPPERQSIRFRNVDLKIKMDANIYDEEYGLDDNDEVHIYNKGGFLTQTLRDPVRDQEIRQLANQAAIQREKDEKKRISTSKRSNSSISSNGFSFENSIKIFLKLMVEGNEPVYSIQTTSSSLNVVNLSYQPQYYLKFLQTLPITDTISISGLIRSTLELLNIQALISINEDITLHRINFTAKGGEMTIIVGEQADRVTLLRLLTGLKKTGEVDGNICFNSGSNSTSILEDYYDNIASVQKKTLYIPGLSYKEMLTYSARLRMRSGKDAIVTSAALIEQRVQLIMEIMNLASCQERKIDEHPSLRGELGGDLKRLSIALEIISLPPIIVVDEPVLNFEPAVALQIMKSLRCLSDRGHIVICSISRPNSSVLTQANRVVMISEGYTIFTSTLMNFESHFCNRDTMGYVKAPDVDIADFMMDIISGIERPIKQRDADPPHIMQEKFEKSRYYDRPSVSNISAFAPSYFARYGYSRYREHPSVIAQRLLVLIQRAFLTKIKDTAIIKASLFGNIVASLLIGFLQYQQGDSGSYCTNLLTLQYASTANITAVLFFCSAYTYGNQVTQIHVICQKLQVFKYEQSVGCSSPFSFILATLIAEIPFCVLYTLIFGNVIYWMTHMLLGVYNYFFFHCVLVANNILGLVSVLMISSILKRELWVRDAFLTLSFSMLVISGFPFQLPVINSFYRSISYLNPMRWAFESLMMWKFGGHYYDGVEYLIPFSFATFQQNDVFEIQLNFILVSCVVIALALLREPVFLQLKTSIISNTTSNNTYETPARNPLGSVGEEVDIFDPMGDIIVKKSITDLSPTRYEVESLEYRKNSNNFRMDSHGLRRKSSDTVRPVLFSRNSSSVTGASSNLLLMRLVREVDLDPGKQDERISEGRPSSSKRIAVAMNYKGPTILVKDVSYRVKQLNSPEGFKTILEHVSAQFDWGKLSAIMGVSRSGKSSLLHLLAGDTGIGTEVTGEVLFNGIAADNSLPLFERCGLVEVDDEHIEDLSVRDVISFAMKLRCQNPRDVSLVEENVGKTIEILHLEKVIDQKVRNLTNGEKKLLSIAEELVNGPTLLLLDEPSNDLSVAEVAVLLATLREMVNTDRTVIATMNITTAAAFSLFDHLVLLSKGRVIYHGPVQSATDFFISSPFGLELGAMYSNPADFLIDVSGCHLLTKEKKLIDIKELETYYESSEMYKKLQWSVKRRRRKISKNESSAPIKLASIETDRVDSSYGFLSWFRSGTKNGRTSVENQSNKEIKTNLQNPLLENGIPIVESETKTQLEIITNELNQSSLNPETKETNDEVNNVNTPEVEIDDEEPLVQIKRLRIQRPLPLFVRAIIVFVMEILSRPPTFLVMRERLFKGRVLIHRSVLGLLYNYELTIGSTILHILLGTTMGTLLGDCNHSYDIYSLTAFYAVGPLILIIIGVQFVQYMFRQQKIFLKENARGLYTTGVYWFVSSLPLYFLRCSNGIIFALITYKIMNLTTNTAIYGYYVLSIMTFVLAGTMLIEVILSFVKTIRDAYLTIPMVVFIEFIFSGLFIKYVSLSEWMKPWIDSFSILRWVLQGNYINTYSWQAYDTNIFFVTETGYSVYFAILNNFSWGDKTTWDCYVGLLYEILSFRILTLIGSGINAVAQRGGRKFKRADQEPNRIF